MKGDFKKTVHGLVPCTPEGQKLFDRMKINERCEAEHIRGQRTKLQNRSLHLYLQRVANTLNESGVSVNTFFNEGYEVPFTMAIVKDELWRPVQEYLTLKHSTADADKLEYGDIYDEMNTRLSAHGIHVPWPEEKNRGEE